MSCVEFDDIFKAYIPLFFFSVRNEEKPKFLAIGIVICACNQNILELDIKQQKTNKTRCVGFFGNSIFFLTGISSHWFLLKQMVRLIILYGKKI